MENLWDLFAFRVIIDSDNIDYCYGFLSKLQSRFNQWLSPKGYADYIAKPKENGYQSLHVVLEDSNAALMEVQIRTTGMNFIAEFGTASHEVYKEGISKKTVGGVVTPSAYKGRRILERLLKEQGLTINDFIDHLGISLEHVPIEHYYEGIGQGEYDAFAIIRKILEEKGRL